MDFDSYARRLWAGRADAYEHGFARLTVHAAGFDAVTGNFVIHATSDPAAVLAELRRVLRAGGRLALTCWSEPPPPVLGIAREALEAAGVSWPRRRVEVAHRHKVLRPRSAPAPHAPDESGQRRPS